MSVRIYSANVGFYEWCFYGVGVVISIRMSKYIYYDDYDGKKCGLAGGIVFGKT